MTGFLGSFSGSMRGVDADHAAADHAGDPPEPAKPDSGGGGFDADASHAGEYLREASASDVVRPADRGPSAAAMAIADQIMGLDAIISSKSPELRLRSTEGEVIAVDTHVVIGRQAAPGQLTIADGRVSRAHARVTVAGGEIAVEDLGSSNGTFIVRDGTIERVGTVAVALQADDRIETVDHLLLAEIVEVGAT